MCIVQCAYPFECLCVCACGFLSYTPSNIILQIWCVLYSEPPETVFFSDSIWARVFFCPFIANPCNPPNPSIQAVHNQLIPFCRHRHLLDLALFHFALLLASIASFNLPLLQNNRFNAARLGSANAIVHAKTIDLFFCFSWILVIIVVGGIEHVCVCVWVHCAEHFISFALSKCIGAIYGCCRRHRVTPFMCVCMSSPNCMRKCGKFITKLMFVCVTHSECI